MSFYFVFEWLDAVAISNISGEWIPFFDRLVCEWPLRRWASEKRDSEIVSIASIMVMVVGIIEWIYIYGYIAIWNKIYWFEEKTA